jgi:hypothetical protein
MQGRTDKVFIPTKYVIINGRVVGATMRRKAAKRSEPWYLAPPPQTIAATLPPPQDEDLPPAKRARLQARTSLLSTATDGVVHAHTAERVTTDPPEDPPTDPVTPAASLPSAAASRAPSRSWKPEEDAKLTEAVQKFGKDCWVTVAAIIPNRTNLQCRQRWVNTVDPANGNNGKLRRSWKPEEDTKLIEAVKIHGEGCWGAVATLVPGRRDKQCRKRWILTLDPANAKKGKWTPEEDAKLTAAVKEHGKHWVAAAAMVPGRTSDQCRKRWVQTLDPARASNTVEEEHNDGNDEALVSVLV